MKGTSKEVTEKSKIEYVPVSPFLPDDNVVKYYLDMIVAFSDKLRLNHVFLHADIAINA